MMHYLSGGTSSLFLLGCEVLGQQLVLFLDRVQALLDLRLTLLELSLS
jgi:hypothetical protein